MMRYHIYRLGIAILFYAILYKRQTTAAELQENHQPDVDEYVYYQGVQGKPGVDFPIYARIPRTGFSCRQIPSGYYADLDTDCQVFHICNEGKKISFLCPNGTIFQQSDLICEWWFKVNCTNSPSFYEESAEQLQEDTWRRKSNRKPGYQNKIAVDQKKFKEVEGAGRRNEHGRGRQQTKKFNANTHESNVNAYPNGRRLSKHKGRLVNDANRHNDAQDNYNNNQQGDQDTETQYTANSNPSAQNFDRSSTVTQYNNNQNGGNNDQDIENQYAAIPNPSTKNIGRSQTLGHYTNNQNAGNAQNQYTASANPSPQNSRSQTSTQYTNNKNAGNHDQDVQNQYTVSPNPSTQTFGKSQTSTQYTNNQNEGNHDQDVQNQYTASPNPSTQQSGRSQTSTQYTNNQNAVNHDQDVQNQYTASPNPSTQQSGSSQTSTQYTNNQNAVNHDQDVQNQYTASPNPSTQQSGRSQTLTQYTNNQNAGNHAHDIQNQYSASPNLSTQHSGRSQTSTQYTNNQNAGNNGQDANNQFTASPNPSTQHSGRSQTSTQYTNNQNAGNNGQDANNQYTASPNPSTQHSGRSQSSTQYTSNQDAGNNGQDANNQYTASPNLSTQNFGRSQTSTQYKNNQNAGNHDQDVKNQYTASPNPPNQNSGRSQTSSQNTNNQNGRNYDQGIQNQYTDNPNPSTHDLGRTQTSTQYNNHQNDQDTQNQYSSDSNPTNDGRTSTNHNNNQHGRNTQNQYSSNSNPSTPDYAQSSNGKPAEETYSRSKSSNQNDYQHTQDANKPQTDSNRKDNGRRINDSNRNVVSHQVQSEIRNKQVHGSRGNMKFRSQVNLKGRNELNYDDSSEESQIPEESASFYKNNQNVIQSTGKYSTANPYPNHKETYTEVHEPKFFSTIAYTTGPQTISPQTYSTNKIPLNDGKPFVVTSPKSSYNIKDDSSFTTESFKYSPTIPPFASNIGVTTIIPNVADANTPDQEEVTFSAPYSNVVTEQLGKIKETTPNSIGYSSQVNSFSGLDDIVHTTSVDAKDYVRITGQTVAAPEKIKLTVSSAQPTKNVQSNLNHITSTTQRTASTPVHRRYSAALSQANPNNACIDEVTPSSTSPSIPSTTTTPDFQVVIGRQRESPTTESQLFKITATSGNSITPEISKPRSFEKATESPIYRVDLNNKVVEKVTEASTLKPAGFYITKSDGEATTKFGTANTYLPKVTTQEPNQKEFNIVVKPKPFELPPRDPTHTTEDFLDSTPLNYEVSSARPFSLEATIAPTQPTPFTRNPRVYENVSNMLNTIREIIKEKNESESRPGLVVPPSAGPQTLHSLAVYFASALDGIPLQGEVEDKDEHKKAIELLTIPTLNKYKDLFKEEGKVDVEVTTVESEEESNDLEGQHTKNGAATPRVRQLAQVFTKALSSYLDDPDMFRKYLQEVRPTEPTNIATTPATTDNNTEEDELLNYSDADIKPELPRLSTTPSVSPTWGYIFAPNNSNSFEHNSVSTDGENLQSADSQSFVSSFNNYVKEKHFGKSTTPLSTDLPQDHWTASQNATTLWRDKLYTNPQAINEDLKNPSTEPATTEIKYELRSLPKIELNSTQVHGILIDFMNTTSNDENSRLKRILGKLNTTQEEFLSRMREIEQNPLTRRLILLLISECATNITQENHKLEGADSQVQVSTLPSLFESSRKAESDKHETVNSRIPKYVDHNLKDDDEDTRALQLLNSLYSIASRYGK